MFVWTHINKYTSRYINRYILKFTKYESLRLCMLNFTSTIKNENKIYSKKNFNNVLMQNIKITEDEEIICEQFFFSKYNLPYALKIPFSDLRLIDTCNNNHNPTILIRKDMILLRTGFLSCVIRYNELWFFEPREPLVIKATNLIKQNLKIIYELKGDMSSGVEIPLNEVKDDKCQENVNMYGTNISNDIYGTYQKNISDDINDTYQKSMCSDISNIWSNHIKIDKKKIISGNYSRINRNNILENDTEINKKDIFDINEKTYMNETNDICNKIKIVGKEELNNNIKEHDNNEKDDINYLNVENNFYRYKGNISFEFLCLDICMQLSIKEYENYLDTINITLRQKIELQQKKEENIEINMLTNNLLKEMMKIKNKLQKLSNLLNALRSNIEKILKNETDMKNMYLTTLNKISINKIKDYSDLEILLETHLQLTDELSGELENMEEKITHYEELMRLNLDYNRNKFILLNAKISFSTLFCSICAVITSLFGMNLKNFIEHNDYAFFIVSIFITSWSIVGIYFTKNINTLLRFFDKYNVK
ncbi:metal ion channel - Mg2+, Co2+ and Ni2+ [Plasmodium sp. gorilla clade G3]|nr:metal ion channel - Mg2+, Co2+ and Ni2+ [Plasmodium sp. gorilla clade G3]